MSEMPSEWRQVAGSVSALALKLKLHLDQAASDEDRAEARQALDRLGDAVEDAVDAVRSAVRDPAVQEDLREVGAALKGAGDHLRGGAPEGVRAVTPRLAGAAAAARLAAPRRGVEQSGSSSGS